MDTNVERKTHLAAASVSTTGLLGSSYSRRNSSGDRPTLRSTVLRCTHSGLMVAVAQWCGWKSRSEKKPDTFFCCVFVVFSQGSKEEGGGGQVSAVMVGVLPAASFSFELMWLHRKESYFQGM